ncbi:MAG: hypothetical protein NC311_16060 [Muribaculaceae bacterium]|nr:hypothetical protein [Muribaculaceae bacterium]
MFNCDLYQAYLDDETDEIPYPCENCAAWVEKTDTCLYEEENIINEAKAVYEAVKAVNPIKTTAKPGCDIQAMVQKEFPDLYKRIYALPLLDWNDLDGVLDYLYGSCKLFPNQSAELKSLITFIEAHCEVRK